MLLQILETKDKTKSIILGGDFNTDYLPKTNLKEKRKRQLSNLMLSFNFKQIVEEPTRVTATTSSCLDIVFSNLKNQTLGTSVQQYGFSDHKSVLLSLQVNSPGLKYLTVDKRIFSEKNTLNFKNALQQINWRDVIKPDKNINENYNAFL